MEHRSPLLDWYHSDDSTKVDRVSLEQSGTLAIAQVLAAPPGDDAPIVLAELDEVEISVVSDDAIAEVHGEFMDDPTPTDVITFQHGEILVSLDTATREAAARNLPVERELLLYVIHGLLHLYGFDDHDPEARQRMHHRQEAVLDQVLGT